MGHELINRLAERLSDRYKFLFRIGKGGWGTVYEVLNIQLDRREALKVVTADSPDAQRSQRFTHEARVVAALDHPRIVKVYAFGEEDGIHWYSMQLLDGPTLGNLLDAGRIFNEAMVARMALPLMDALDYSHGRGVIHRDIKPANILFNSEGRPFLADFGIAKSRENIFETQTGQLLGTPAFISPEQALGEVVDARADQYSFAITLYKAVTGHLPFAEEGQIQTLMQRVRQDADPIWTYRPDLAAGFAQVIMKALSRYREDRWATMADMRAAMLEACDEISVVWNLPLSGIAEIPLVREPLQALVPETGALGKNLNLTDVDPTADLVRSRSNRFRRWPWLAAAAVLGVLGWSLTKQAARPDSPPLSERPRGVESQPEKKDTPALPQTGEVLPKAAPVQKPTATPLVADPVSRRPVQPPQLLDAGSPPSGFPASCQGVQVNVSLLIGEEGQVKGCKVLNKVSTECAEAAIALAKRYRFKPATDAENRPVESNSTVAIDF